MNYSDRDPNHEEKGYDTYRKSNPSGSNPTSFIVFHTNYDKNHIDETVKKIEEISGLRVLVLCGDSNYLEVIHTIPNAS